MLFTSEFPQEFDRRIGERISILATGHGRVLAGETRPVFRVATTDVSRTGLMVTCPPWVTASPGEAIHLVFPAERQEMLCDLNGRVVWKRPAITNAAGQAPEDPASPWCMGIALAAESRPEVIKLMQPQGVLAAGR